MQSTVRDVTCIIVCVSVCVLFTLTYYAKTAEQIEMPFRGWITWVKGTAY